MLLVLSNILRSLKRPVCLLMLLGTFLPFAASAETYPSKPIKIVVGYAPGGATDTLARLYASKLQTVLGTPVLVENKPGAGEAIAVQTVLAAKPDGYTLLIGTTGSLVQVPLTKDVPYDPIKSFSYVGRFAEVDAVLAVRNDLPVGSTQELIDYARKNPGKLNYSSAGVGAANHLLMEYITTVTNVSMTHIPFKGEADAVRELVAGNVEVAVGTSGTMSPYVQERRVKGLAVTGSQRLKGLPNVPTLAEGSIPELRSLGVFAFFGIVGPAGMPQSVIQALSDAVNKVSIMPEVRESTEKSFIRIVTGTPSDFQKYVDKELTQWRDIAKKIKL